MVTQNSDRISAAGSSLTAGMGSSITLEDVDNLGDIPCSAAGSIEVAASPGCLLGCGRAAPMYGWLWGWLGSSACFVDHAAGWGLNAGAARALATCRADMAACAMGGCCANDSGLGARSCLAVSAASSAGSALAGGAVCMGGTPAATGAEPACWNVAAAAGVLLCDLEACGMAGSCAGAAVGFCLPFFCRCVLHAASVVGACTRSGTPWAAGAPRPLPSSGLAAAAGCVGAAGG